MQKLGLEWSCEKFCIGKKLMVCNVLLLWVWRSSVWMNEKEKMAKLGFFCFVGIERILEKKAMIVEDVKHFDEWE